MMMPAGSMQTLGIFFCLMRNDPYVIFQFFFHVSSFTMHRVSDFCSLLYAQRFFLVFFYLFSVAFATAVFAAAAWLLLSHFSSERENDT